MRKRERVVLVDENGHDLIDQNGIITTMEKLVAHRLGVLHSAVSVFIFNNDRELLLQKRASDKYHSSEKWSNTCCTHPFSGESPTIAAQRRLYEEMGLKTTITKVFTFLYKGDVGNDMIENEYDHVFFGISNQDPLPDPLEVSDWRWQSLGDLEKELDINPEKYSVWFRECFNVVKNHKLDIMDKGTYSTLYDRV